MVDHIKAQLAAQGISPPRGQKPSQEQRKPAQHTSIGVEPKEPRKSKEKPLVDKQAMLPPPPPDGGPWQAGNWTMRRATTYEPTARVVLCGPSEEFEQLLAHLKLFQP